VDLNGFGLLFQAGFVRDEIASISRLEVIVFARLRGSGRAVVLAANA
jgi:hypothetical protein